MPLPQPPALMIDGSEVLVRRFRAGEEEALRRVFYEAVHTLAARDYSPEQRAAWTSGACQPEAWAERIRQLAPFVAEVAGVVAGYADVQHDGMIDHFYVAPAVARRGVGSLLMRRIHETARTRGLPALMSHVSITARCFFAAWGFATLATQPLVRDGVAMTNYRMRKTLPTGQP